MKHLSYIIITALFLSLLPGMAEGRLGLQKTTLSRLICQPSAWQMMEGQLETQLRFYSKGGLMASVKYAPSERIYIGVSYGGTHVLDNTGIVYNKTPGIFVKYILFEKTLKCPTVAVGIETQGWGNYQNNPDTDEKRYFIKPPGIFLVMGKTLFLFCKRIEINLQGGLCKFPVKEPDDNDLNFFMGIEHRVYADFIYIVLEYDAALNDDSPSSFGEGNGYLNGSIRFQISDNLEFEILFIDMLANNKTASNETKMFRIVYQSL